MSCQKPKHQPSAGRAKQIKQTKGCRTASRRQGEEDDIRRW